MSTKNNNIIKYNHGEKSYTIYIEISIHHWVIQYLLIVHSMNQKTNLIIIEKMIV